MRTLTEAPVYLASEETHQGQPRFECHVSKFSSDADSKDTDLQIFRAKVPGRICMSLQEAEDLHKFLGVVISRLSET